MKRGLFLIFVFCVISNAYAQMDCESIPSCAEMGYTQDSCAGGKGIRCPFDETKFYCAGAKQLPDAPEPEITPEEWTAGCADKIDYCATYNADCKCTACEEKYLLADSICIPECVKSVAICAAENKIFKEETCTCESCPSGYLFDSEANECREACKKDIEHCLTYDSQWTDCKCQTCETNYLLDGEVCKKMCTVVDNCTTYDSDYDPCSCTACKDGYILENDACVIDSCAEKCKVAYPLFAGSEYTNLSIDQVGDDAIVEFAASQFYVGDKNGDFGQGKWYLPSIGEWMYLYGTDVNQMTGSEGSTGAIGDNIAVINEALNTLKNKGAEAGVAAGYGIVGRTYWSSSRYTSGLSWAIGIHNDGTRDSPTYVCGRKILVNSNPYNVRFSLLLKNIFTLSTGGTEPKIGDVMYSDKTYGPAENYDGSKIPVGVIASVSTNKRDVTIINLKDLTFRDPYFYSDNERFDPDNPYGNSTDEIKRGSVPLVGEIFTEIGLLKIAKASDNCPCHFYKPE